MQLFREAKRQDKAYIFTTTDLLWQWLGSVIKENLLLDKPTEINLHNDRIKHILRRMHNDYAIRNQQSYARARNYSINGYKLTILT